MSNISLEHDNIIYQEMMSHPALFSHLKPQMIAIMGDQNDQILQEVVKHTPVKEIWSVVKDENFESNTDPRVRFMLSQEWLVKTEPSFFDVLIISEEAETQQFPDYFTKLTAEGILIQQSESPFQVDTLKQLQQHLKMAGFCDILTLNFPQPNFPSGWRSAIMAKKNGVFKKIREKDIFNRQFSTHYYNFDIHKAALALPEFMRHELTI